MSLKTTPTWPFTGTASRDRFKDRLRFAEQQIASGHPDLGARRVLQRERLAGNEPAKLNRIGESNYQPLSRTRYEGGRVLVVDDDEVFCGFADILLSDKGYQVVTETDARKVLGLLRSHHFDVLLLDLEMPEVHGLELLEQVREHWNVLPILIVTAHGGGEATVEAMRRGATDFVIKPVDGSHLDLRIRAARDLEQARRLANTDGLTGLYNHRYLHQRLEQEIERVGRYKRNLSLVMADIDHFKAYNDTFGHPGGDAILIAVAEALRQVSRSADIAARYGGDEFVLILPETPAGEARVMAERARRHVERLHLPAGEGSIRTEVTLSLGVASFPGTAGGKEDLIGAADAALYEAKRTGRNRVIVAGQALAADAGFG